jgi:hypothetical protein
VILALQVVQLDNAIPPFGKQLHQALVPLVLPRGESLTLHVTVVGQDATPQDLTGKTLTFTVRASKFDPSPVLQKTLTPVLATSGTATLTLVPTDTNVLPFGVYGWDLWSTATSPAFGEQLVPFSTFTLADEAL